MYADGLNVAVQSKDDTDVSEIKTSVDEAESVVKVQVPESIKAGSFFEVVISPK